MSGDLNVRKRALTPIKSLIYGLRRYDLERSAAVHSGGNASVGYMSAKTKIYLADIYDHIEFILASLDTYSAMTENLIRFSFDVSCLLVGYCSPARAGP
jgi:Mg2+ and Co2+ transporter CorA